MPLLITLVFFEKWLGIKFKSREAEVNTKPRDITYMEFSETRPPIFVKVEEPLEADEWIRVMEQKFGLIRCTETQKPLFAAQQLRGPTSTWWANFEVVQPEGHLVTWAEFKQAFMEHYIPDGVL